MMDEQNMSRGCMYRALRFTGLTRRSPFLPEIPEIVGDGDRRISPERVGVIGRVWRPWRRM